VVTAAIAARKRAEQSLRQTRDELEIKVAERTAAVRRSEKELRDVLETIPAMAWSASPDSTVEFMNRAWQDYTGLPRVEGFALNWENPIHPDDRVRTLTEWQAEEKEGQPVDTEVRLRRADGEYRWWFVRNVPLRDELGNILKWYGTAIDIEDLKRAEQALSSSKRNLAEAQRLTHTGSFVWDITTNKPLYLSDEWYRIYGIDPEKEVDAFAKRVERIAPEDLSRWQAAVDRAISENSNYELEFRLVLPDGTTKYVHAVGHPISNSVGKVMQFMGSVTDVTERKRAEALLAG